MNTQEDIVGMINNQPKEPKVKLEEKLLYTKEKPITLTKDITNYIYQFIGKIKSYF